MKKLIVVIVILLAAYEGASRSPTFRQLVGAPGLLTALAPGESSDVLLAAIRDQRSGTQVTGEGIVSAVLADDNTGSRHQRFILTLPSGQTLLVAHNIDLAPRIPSLVTGDRVSFNGVYEWNPKGGVIHWTHHDPGGRHEAGWLRHGGQTYE
ncbi:DUF3465 domain-containing protein [Comamonadaceae bacterium G21597-S1]|nr:DUF3465 domain-containing protein [Comamonadaceae bacterium G21597-S1]